MLARSIYIYGACLSRYLSWGCVKRVCVGQISSPFSWRGESAAWVYGVGCVAMSVRALGLEIYSRYVEALEQEAGLHGQGQQTLSPMGSPHSLKPACEEPRC